MKKFFVIAFLFIMPAVFAQAKSHVAPQTETKRIDVRVEPFPDLFFSVLKLSFGSGTMPELEGLAEAVEAARPLRDVVSGLRTFHFIAVPAIHSTSAAELEKDFAQLPETVQAANGETIQLRERAVALAKALSRIEDAFRKKVWPQHKAEIDKAAAEIAQRLIPKTRECFAYISKSLGMSEPVGTVPLYLVYQAPRPEGFTFRQRDGKGVCLMGVTANTGTLLFEIALHESIHALDVESAGERNALVEIRNRLMKAGLKPDDPDMRNVPHTLMFIQAAETIRRIVDPSHKHYGEVKGYYERVPLPSKIELPIWIAYLDGKITRDEAIAQIVEGFLKARKEG
ncbi:MAG TPA: hypothetical protein VID27_17030 [Blastocatellia bacterium]|jgi:hypothetical protein